MTALLVMLTVLAMVEVAGIGYLIFLDYQARHACTPGEAAIFQEMRRVLEEAR
jgi:hypothetical protein